jgi:hypothetical protein
MIFFVQMKKNLLILSLLSAALAASCSTSVNSNTTANVNAAPVPTAKNVPYPSVERISLANAKAEYDAGSAVFIDTHSEASFRKEHITGAINITASDLAKKADSIPKGKKIIAYCS